MDDMELKTRSIEDYYNESLNALTFDEVTLQAFQQQVGVKIARWSKYLYDEERVLEYGKNVYSCVYKKVWHNLMFGEKSEIADYKVDKKNLNIYIDADKSIKEAKTAVHDQEEKCKFIQNVIDALKNQSFILNNYVKHLIWKSGGEV